MSTKEMEADADLSNAVAEELKLDPAIDASDIAITVHAGVVTMNGSVPSYWQKVEAEDAVRRVMGVRALANDVTVDPPDTHVRGDTDIATAAAAALSWHSDVPDLVQATVTNGWVRLTGKVDWQFQRTVAENVVGHLRGVRGVTNDIAVMPRPDLTPDAAAADYRGHEAATRPVSWAALNVILEQIDRRLKALEER